MELAGVIIRAFPADLAQVRTQLTTIPGLEIHIETDDGRLIATLEGTNQSDLSQSLNRLQEMERLLSVSMVYQYSEESEQFKGRESSA